MASRCLYCMRAIDSGLDYHAACSRRFFGAAVPPALDLSLSSLREYAAVSVLNRITVTGVQKKLSLGVETTGRDSRFTIVGMWGRFVLKPPVEEYPFLPENEDTVMRLAALSGIGTVPHALIRLASGERCFISRRIDRAETGEKIHMEDLCQVSERLTEDKYHGSTERCGKLIRRHSVYPGVDALEFFSRVVFSFVTGNADMHLKNYSLIETEAGMRLSPAYDLVSTALAIPGDPEETALTVNGKKAKLRRGDFDSLAAALGIPRKPVENVYALVAGMQASYGTALAASPLPDDSRETLRRIIDTRIKVFT